jgi:hypothetical protein
MGDATTALAAARDHGLSPGDVRKLIAFCRANVDRWENPSGALWKRILVGWPGQAVGDGWPEPRGDRKSIEAKARRDRQNALALAQDRDENEEAARRAISQAESNSALEVAFGSRLDGLDRLDRDALAADVLRAGSLQWQRYQRETDERISDPLIRLALLGELRRRSQGLTLTYTGPKRKWSDER